MKRTSFFIDGFNLFHSINHPHYFKYKWLDLTRLCGRFVHPTEDRITKIYFFTTYATWKKESFEKHQKYVRALESTGIEIVFGVFRESERYCGGCKKMIPIRSEKQTDVNIAIKLLETATFDLWDKAVLLTGDSDLVPAVKAIKRIYPHKEVNILVPIGRRANELKQVSDTTMKIKEIHLRTCQFENQIKIGEEIICKPENWA